VVVATAGVAAWLWLAEPRVEAGSFTAASGGLRLVGGGGQPTRYEIDGTSTGTVWVSVRNAGRVPLTLTGLAGGHTLFPSARWGLAPPSGDAAATPLGTAPVRVPPDREAYVALAVQAPRCGTFEAGSALTAEHVRLGVRALGREQQVTAPLRLTMRFREARTDPRTCP
jgi:hypothetical protein